MKFRIRTRIAFLALTFAAAGSVGALYAQRLPNRIDNRSKTVLRGSRNPRLDSLTSDGPVDDGMRIYGLTFRFQPAPDQSAALQQLLEELQDPSSPRYHSWLTPEQYGERFGLSAADTAKISDWIVSQGFQIDYTAKSRTHISFSGTAAQVREAFGTELHRYTVNGKKHFGNAREIMIPAQIEPLVYTLGGLDDLPQLTASRIQPRVNREDGHAVTPGDLAVIYNLTPLFKKGLDGTGQKIAVAGRTKFNVQDVRDFRDHANLPASDPKMLLIPGSKDPGYTDDIGEALLDVQWVGASAPGASIIYVYGTDIVQATQYAIDQNLAPVLSWSYAQCEKLTPQSMAQLYRNMAQQAAAEGITWVACTGDTGAAGCENQSKDSLGVSGLSAKLPASVPEVTAVGGTTFAEGADNYWSSVNQDDGTSALSYIPEVGWNDTPISKLLNSSGGGPSIFFTRPSWQYGPGVPNDNVRHIPDVSFTASGIHDPYLVVETGGVVKTGGTSAGTPFFAGVVALLNQYLVAARLQTYPGLGNINPRLYELARTTRGVFHDVTAGNNIVPCKAGTPDCTTGQYGYSAGTGFDHVTGLGSVDIAGLVQYWASSNSNGKSGSVVVPSVEPSPVYQQEADADGYAWYYTVKVTETAGAPTTITAFSMDGYDFSDYIADWFGSTSLPANDSLSVDLRSKDMDVPSDHVFEFAGVDANGQKWAKQVTVSFRGPKQGNGGAAMSLTSDPPVVEKIGSGDPDCAKDHPYGQTLTLKELNGAPVKLTKFVAGGSDYTNYIATWFGAQTLPASGTLNAKLCWQLTTVPVTLDYEMDGVDGSGNQVQATLKVDFKNTFDQKSGAVSEVKPALSGWPGRPRTPEAGEAARRRAKAPHRTPGGMVVAPRTAVGSAESPARQ